MFFYILFIGYLIYLHPRLLARVAVAGHENPDPPLGWLFLAIHLFELLGFWLKLPIARQYAHDFPTWFSAIATARDERMAE